MSATTEILCESCDASYTILASALQPGGLYVKCSACGAAFTAYPKSDEPPAGILAALAEAQDLLAALEQDAGSIGDEFHGEAEADVERDLDATLPPISEADFAAESQTELETLVVSEFARDPGPPPAPIASEHTPSDPGSLFQSQGELLHAGAAVGSSPPPAASRRSSNRVTDGRDSLPAEMLLGVPIPDAVVDESPASGHSKRWVLALAAALLLAAAGLWVNGSSEPMEQVAAVGASPPQEAGPPEQQDSADARAGLALIQMQEADALLTRAAYGGAAAPQQGETAEAAAEKARAIAAKVLEENPDQVAAHRALARYAVMRNSDASVHLGVLPAGDPEATLLRARARSTDEYERAKTEIEALLPTLGEAEQALLVVHDRAGKGAVAAALARAILVKTPDNPVAGAILAKYTAAAAPADDPYLAVMQKADKLRGRKRFGPALKLLEAARAMRPGHPDAAAAIGWCYLGMRQANKALAEFAAVASHSPDYADAHLGSGDALRLLGNKAAAVLSYQRYLELLPQGPGAKQARRWASKLAPAKRR